MKVFLFILLIFSLLLINQCKLKDEEDKEKETLIQQLLNDNIGDNNNTNNSNNNDDNNNNSYNCIQYNLSIRPTFTELQEKGVFNNCIQCHNVLKSDGNLNLLEYNQTISRVEPGDPQNSLLYQKVTTGTMKNYSNSCINDAIRKWIEAGGQL